MEATMKPKRGSIVILPWREEKASFKVVAVRAGWVYLEPIGGSALERRVMLEELPVLVGKTWNEIIAAGPSF